MAALVTPDPRYRVSFLEAMAEFAAEGRGGDGSQVGEHLAKYDGTWHTDEGFAAYLDDVIADGVPETPRPSSRVPSTNLWWVDGDHWIGRLSIRHELTEFLRMIGGHIGYDVRRTRRRQGHATAMLRAALPRAHDLDIDPALITCDADNLASRKVIEACDGQFEATHEGKLRYWVPTGSR